ncbi:MAG: hypothetical protein NC548_04385 [Lachnospiraceae bacterium]|nr:hypothetical protein [Lachnospiraceae bacterium]
MTSDTPHGKRTGWDFCVSHHAKILFMGICFIDAIQYLDHMPLDIMGDKWPIRDWYNHYKYRLTVNDEEAKEIRTQKGCWIKYAIKLIVS